MHVRKAAVYHRAMAPFVYKYDADTVHIRLQTERGDIERVRLVHGDPYEWDAENPEDLDWNFDPAKAKFWKTTMTEMEYSGTDGVLDYWFVSIKPPNRRVRYGFELTSGEEVKYYTERGFYDEKPVDHPGYYFSVPYLNAIDVFDAPEWVKDTVWYQIFPDRFANGDPSNDPEGTEAWGGTPRYTNMFGGDFQGVIDKVGYLRELGVTGIYFCPVFLAPSNHKYDTLDYFKLDPQFGTEEKFREMISVLHDNGIKVLLDAVFNHVSNDHPYFKDVVENGEASPYKDWFHLKSLPVTQEPVPNYEVFAFEANMPKLNTENPEVIDYLLSVGRHWVEKFDVDGWRLDVASEIDHAFWRAFRTAVKSAKPDAYIVGECWTDSQEWLFGDQFDAIMNYLITESFLQFFAVRKTKPSDFVHDLSRNLFTNMQGVNEVTFNLVGSHDTPRALNRADGDKDRLRLLLLALLTFSGTPVLYYGDEVGLDGGQDPDNRRCMPWDETQDRDLFDFTRKLIALRREHRALANDGDISFPFVDDEKNVYAMKREGDGTYYVCFNNSGDDVEFPVLEGARGFDLLTEQHVTEVNLPAYSGTIIQVVEQND